MKCNCLLPGENLIIGLKKQVHIYISLLYCRKKAGKSCIGRAETTLGFPSWPFTWQSRNSENIELTLRSMLTLRRELCARGTMLTSFVWFPRRYLESTGSLLIHTTSAKISCELPACCIRPYLGGASFPYSLVCSWRISQSGTLPERQPKLQYARCVLALADEIRTFVIGGLFILRDNASWQRTSSDWKACLFLF